MKYFKKLVGRKCYLSPVNPGDVEMFTAWLNDLEVTRNLNLAVQNVTLVTEQAALERLAKDSHVYSIVDLETDTLIGNLGLTGIDHINRGCVIGIFIGDKEYWGKGYGAEAMQLLLGYAFDYLNMNNVMLTVYEFNERAYACYKKIGFKEIGRRRKAICRKGRFYDHIFMDILAEEFRAIGPRKDSES
jgi:RimJ/RimL family protein N-acetyltransferase